MSNLRDNLLQRAHNASYAERLQLVRECLAEASQQQFQAMQHVLEFHDSLILQAKERGYDDLPDIICAAPFEQKIKHYVQTAPAVEIMGLEPDELVGSIAIADRDITDNKALFKQGISEVRGYLIDLGEEEIFNHYLALTNGFDKVTKWTIRANAILGNKLGTGEVQNAKKLLKRRVREVVNALKVSTSAIQNYCTRIIKHADELGIEGELLDSVIENTESYAGLDYDAVLQETIESIEGALVKPELDRASLEIESELQEDLRALENSSNICAMFFTKKLSEEVRKDLLKSKGELTDAMDQLREVEFKQNKDRGQKR